MGEITPDQGWILLQLIAKFKFASRVCCKMNYYPSLHSTRAGCRKYKSFCETDCKDTSHSHDLMIVVSTYKWRWRVFKSKPRQCSHLVIMRWRGYEGCYWDLLLFVHLGEKDVLSKCVCKYWDSLTIPGSGDLTLTVAAAQNSNRWEFVYF